MVSPKNPLIVSPSTSLSAVPTSSAALTANTSPQSPSALPLSASPSPALTPRAALTVNPSSGIPSALPPSAPALANDGHTFYDDIYGHPKLSEDTFERELVFVIMSFSRRSGRKMLDIYSAIKDECEKLNLKATRVDENVGGGFILGETITLIQTAEFIICDLTHERPNVYYELGYAHGVGNQPLNILMIAREGTDVHFDIAPFRVQFYRSTKHLRTIIADTFKDMVRLKREKDALLSQKPSPASDDPAHKF